MNKKQLSATVVAGVGAISAAQAADIEMVIHDRVYPIVLEEHAGTAAFVAMLPLTLTFENYGSTERIAYLPRKLVASGMPDHTTPKRGDITIYLPWGNVAVFVKDFRESPGLMPMGHLSEAALKGIVESGDAPVTFRRRE